MAGFQPQDLVGHRVDAGSNERLSRRHLIRGAFGAGAALSLGGLLAACGGGSTSPTATGAATSGSAATPAGAASAPTSAASASSAAPQTAGGGAPTAATAGQPGGELIYGVTNKFDTLDPNVTTFTDVGRMAYHLFDPLVWQPKPGEFIPGLADKWDINQTADEYTFHLRQGVTFHDGTPFNADAIKFTFDRIVNPDLKSQSAFSLIGPYDSSTVMDPATIKVKFTAPFAPFLDSSAQPYLAPVSPTAVNKFGKDFGVNPVGTGPFKFDSYKTDNVVRMVKNPDYKWGPTLFKHQGAVYLDAISWRIIPEPATRLAALKSGEVHFIQDVPTQDYKDLQGNGSIQILEGASAGSGESMMMNVTKPPTDDAKVRQALEWGVDKAGMNKAVWQGLYKPTNSPLTSVMFGYDPATANTYSYDPKKAGALLDEAGWTLSGNVRKKNGQDLALGLYYRSDNADASAMATFLQGMYAPIGVKVDLNGLAQSGYFNAVRAGQHNLQFWIETATDPDVVRVLFYSKNADGGTNRNRYKNAEMDKLIDDAAASTDPAKRKTLYAQIQKKALDEAIMVFFADAINIFAFQKAKVRDPLLDWSANYPLFYDTTLAK